MGKQTRKIDVPKEKTGRRRQFMSKVNSIKLAGLVTVVVTFALLYGCSGGKQIRQAEKEAIDELCALQVAVSTGLNYQDYGKRLTDMNVAINKILRSEFIDSSDPFWIYIADAAADYQVAYRVWGKKFDDLFGPKNFICEEEPLYEVLTKQYPSLKVVKLSDGKAVYIDTVIQAVWLTASAHIELADAISKGTYTRDEARKKILEEEDRRAQEEKDRKAREEEDKRAREEIRILEKLVRARAGLQSPKGSEVVRSKTDFGYIVVVYGTSYSGSPAGTKRAAEVASGIRREIPSVKRVDLAISPGPNRFGTLEVVMVVNATEDHIKKAKEQIASKMQIPEECWTTYLKPDGTPEPKKREMQEEMSVKDWDFTLIVDLLGR